MLRSARNRLMPVNTHVLTEALEHLIRLEDTPGDGPPKEASGSTRVVRLWAEACLALLRNEPEKAEETLSSLLLETDMETFRYILSEAAFRLCHSEPRIRRFFGF